MTFISLFLLSGGIILTLMVLLWLLSLALKNASIVDIFWGTGFVIVNALALLASGNFSPRDVLLTAIVSVWGLRLSYYIYVRNHGKREDFRYAAWRQENGPRWWWFSLFQVFLLQGVLMWVISTPLITVHTTSLSPAMNFIDWLGLAFWLIGFYFEATGDWQLAQFKKDPANKGKLMTTGIWQFTRHPNYFGDAAQWWGFYLLALAVGAWWTVFSPILMTFLLMRVSGVVMLEKTMSQRPGFQEYAGRTNSFFPWFPKNPNGL